MRPTIARSRISVPAASARGSHVMSTLEIVGYDNIQFTKAQNVLRGMGLEQLSKNEKAKQELAKKGMAFNQS
jgi:hypothetical protein